MTDDDHMFTIYVPSEKPDKYNYVSKNLTEEQLRAQA